MNIDEYTKLDATGLAALVKAGEVTAGEVSETAQAALDSVNARLNVVAQRLETPIDGAADGPPVQH